MKLDECILLNRLKWIPLVPGLPRTQKPLGESPCGFDPRPRHHSKSCTCATGTMRSSTCRFGNCARSNRVRDSPTSLRRGVPTTPHAAKARGVGSQVFRGFACGALGAAALRIPLTIQRPATRLGGPLGPPRSLAQCLSFEIRGVARAARARTDGSQTEMEEMMSPVGKQID